MSISFRCCSQALSISSEYPFKIYQWIKNPMTIVLENHSCEELIVKSNVGQISGSNCNYVYILEDTSVNSVRISVGVMKRKNINWVKEIDFPVKPIPTPRVFISISEGRPTISKSELLVVPKILIPDYHYGEGVGGDRKQRVVGYSIKITRNDSIIHEVINVTGNDLLNETIDFIKTKVQNNDLLIVDDILILLYGKERRKIEGNLKVRIISED